MVENAPKIVFQKDCAWLIVAKPAGFSVHNEPGKDLLSWLGEQSPSVKNYFPVHRLDRETSGLVLVALSKRVAALLGEILAAREITKIYKALVLGEFRFLPSEGLWHFSLTDKAEGYKSPRGHPKGRRPCESSYKLIEQYDKSALLTLSPLTGRKHQLRRHTAVVGNPILGDYRYSQKFDDQSFRIALHAETLRFICPLTKEKIEVTTPPGQDFWDMKI